MRKGIILAAGSGTRFYPATQSISKQLLPVYDKPMIYYPLSTLMLAGLREILIITLPHEMALFKRLLGDGSQWGIALHYAIQEKPRGIADAFLIAESFIGASPVCLMLGDNILYGQGVAELLQTVNADSKPTIFGYYVNDPERYGIIYFDKDNRPYDIVEKPKQPTSHFAAIGLYFYTNDAVKMSKELQPSQRGELEITDISRAYLQAKQLVVKKLGRGIAWLDTGTPNSWLEAANFIQILEHRQGLKLGCPEEVAFRMKYITDKQLAALAQPLMKSGYGQYLMQLLHHPEEIEDVNFRHKKMEMA